MTEDEIIKALEEKRPFAGLTGVSVGSFKRESGPKDTIFDVSFEIRFGETSVKVYAETKNACTPKMVQQTAPWLARFKQVQTGFAFALVCPSLSSEAQAICLENGIDFIDLNGNICISVPGKFFLQRTGIQGKSPARYSLYRNPFLGKSSRVLRILLQTRREWTLTGIADQLTAESRRTQQVLGKFEISLASISRTLRSLEEELLVRRRNSTILVPEPKRLLMRWAEKYKERYPWNLRRSFKLPNPFGNELSTTVNGLRQLLGSPAFVMSGAAAASLTAPFVDLSTVDIYVLNEEATTILRNQGPGIGFGPPIRVIYPYDYGVFMYSKLDEGLPRVSDVQAFLDLYAQGGRDLKQAEYLLETTIMPRWEGK